MSKFVLAAALIMSASVASAMCKHGHQQAMSCADGQTYDAEAGACVPKVSS